jgi:ABC-type multidrug transport system permease subunit
MQRINLFYAGYKEVEVPLQIEKSDIPVVSNKIEWPSTWAFEFITLLGRNLIDNFRSLAIVGAAIGQALFLAFLISLLYWQVKPDASGIQNRLGVFFFLSINLTFGVVLPSINVFPEQKRLIKRERAAGSYRSTSAFLAKWISNLPTMLLTNIIMAVIVYWTVGLRGTVNQFFVFIAIVVAHGFCANSFGLLIGSAVPNATVGQLVAPMIIIIFMLFGGLLLNLDNVPVFLRWIQWMSMISYTYKALAQNEFDSTLTFNCTPGSPCFTSGVDVVNIYALNNPSMWTCIFINLGFSLGYMFLGMIVFARTSRPLMRLK